MRNIDELQDGIEGSDVSPETLATYDSILELQESGLISARDAARHILSLNRTFFHAGYIARRLQFQIGKNIGGEV